MWLPGLAILTSDFGYGRRAYTTPRPRALGLTALGPTALGPRGPRALHPHYRAPI